MKELIKSINKAALELEPIGKNKVIGSGRNAYKGVQWSDVAAAFHKVLHNNGLVMVPESYDVKTTQTEGVDQYGKTKNRVFVEVVAVYKLAHVSGESLTVAGLGQGVDTQDKAAGKATTYAMKNALMYAFTVAADMDDADETHSDELPKTKPMITEDALKKAIKAVKEGKATIEKVESKYRLTDKQKTLFK